MIADVLKADLKGMHKTNVAISGTKFLVAAALAWKILPRLPHPKTAAVIAATVTTMAMRPSWDSGRPDLWYADALEDPVGKMHELGLFSLLAGVQAATLIHSIGALKSVWQTSKIAAIPLGGLLAYSATDFVWDKGLIGFGIIRD